jgi:hypothetical protein
MRSILTFCLFVWSYASALATIQYPDRLEHKDMVFEFGSDFSSPLYKLLQTEPKRWPKEFPSGGSPLWTSALQRGHIGLYRVSQGKLWLVSIEVPISEEDFEPCLGRVIDDRFYAPFPLARLFPACGGAVHAAWFSGEIKITRPPSKAELAVDKTISTRHETLIFKDGCLTFATKRTITPKTAKPEATR